MSDIESDGSEEATEHTHYCDDCGLPLTLMYDERDSEDTPVVCGHCGGTNTREVSA